MKQIVISIIVSLFSLSSQGQDLATLLKRSQSSIYAEKKTALIDLANFYTEQKSFIKSVEYWSKVVELDKSITGKIEINSEIKLAESLYQSRQYAKCIEGYKGLIEKLTLPKDSATLFTTWIHLIDCYEKTGNPSESLNQYKVLTKQFAFRENSSQNLTQLNHRAVLETKLKNISQAADYLNQANAIANENRLTFPVSLQRDILINLATVNGMQTDYFAALDNLSLASQLRPIADFELANMANRKGAIYLLMKRFEDAEKEALFAISLLNTNQSSISSQQILVDSYELLTKLYKGKERTKHQANEILLAAQRQRITNSNRLVEELDLKKAIDIEKQEATIKEQINVNEREENYLRQLQLEKKIAKSNLEVKEQEILIQKQNQKLELTQLEKKLLAGKQAEQQLVIEKQQLVNSVQQNELRQQQLSKANQQQEITLTRTEKQVVNKQLALEAGQMRFSRYVSILVSIVFILSLLVIANLWKNRRKLRTMVNEKTAQLARANLELSKNNEQLEQYSYMVAHNLRGTAARLTGLSAIYDIVPLNEQGDIISKMRNESNLLDTMIKDMNQILEVKNGQDQPIELVSLLDSLNRIKQILKVEIDRSHAVIKIDLNDIKFFSFVPTYFDNILYNLVSNAIKYQHPDRAPAIKISAYHDNGFDVLRVSDNGLGIDLEKNKNKVFGLYKRFHPQKEGKGIGLYMVKTQMESLGGKIELHSTLNVGSEFVLFFPLQVM